MMLPALPCRLANALVGNADHAAALEVTLTGPTMKFLTDTGEIPRTISFDLHMWLPVRRSLMARRHMQLAQKHKRPGSPA